MLINKKDYEKELKIREKSQNDQILFFKKKLKFTIIMLIISVLIYGVGAFLIIKYLPIRYLSYSYMVLLFLLLLICFGIKEIIRLKKIIKKLIKN